MMILTSITYSELLFLHQRTPDMKLESSFALYVLREKLIYVLTI